MDPPAPRRSFDPVPYTEGVTDMDKRARVNKANDKKKRTEHPSSPVRKLRSSRNRRRTQSAEERWGRS